MTLSTTQNDDVLGSPTKKQYGRKLFVPRTPTNTEDDDNEVEKGGTTFRRRYMGNKRHWGPKK